MRAAIYARFSSDSQKETSITDQIRLCRDAAVNLGMTVVGDYSDLAISGAVGVAKRPQGRFLLADARDRKFEVILLESLDRLSRDIVDGEMTIRTLEHLGIRLIGVSDGYDSNHRECREINRAVKTLVSQQYLRDLSDKTHRGMTGQVKRGCHAGGNPGYGYRSVPNMSDGGETSGFRLEIVPDEAAIVRRIFAEMGKGRSCREIADDLNRECVSAPGGVEWSISALYGNPNKGSGILNNECYIGRFIWNRSRWVRDPETQKRRRLPNPPEEWVIDERPELRIVSNDLWSAARARMAPCDSQAFGIVAPPTKRTLWGGVLRCGYCGSELIAVNSTYYGCANRKNHGPAACRGLLIRRDRLEAGVVKHLGEALTNPEAISLIREQAAQFLRALSAEVAAGTEHRKKRRAGLERRKQKLLDALEHDRNVLSVLEELRRVDNAIIDLRRVPHIPSPEDIPSAIQTVLANLAPSMMSEPQLSRMALMDVLSGGIVEESETPNTLRVRLPTTCIELP